MIEISYIAGLVVLSFPLSISLSIVIATIFYNLNYCIETYMKYKVELNKLRNLNRKRK